MYHLWLLIQKSLRYAWRRRVCRCCPKAVFELVAPTICLLLLCLLRWMHTPSATDNPSSPSFDGSKPTRIQMTARSIVPQRESINVLTYASIYPCPSASITVKIANKSLLNRLKGDCPQSDFSPPSKSADHGGNLRLTTSAKGPTINYRCRYDNAYLCQSSAVLEKSVPIEHPSVSLCSSANDQDTNSIMSAYLAIQSRLYPPKSGQKLSVFTWPCSSYASDALFELAPSFSLSAVLILIDGCILFSFNLLLDALIDEKHQGITELLRLISIRPILNSLAWFLRVFAMQFVIAVFLIVILKASFEGGTYLPYVPVWLVIPSILLWTIQVLSRSVLVAHFFSSNLKASLWSWVIYGFSFWLAVSSSLRLPTALHLLASAWLPFYSIKRQVILMVRINTDLGRQSHSMTELMLIWLSMALGSLLMWLLAYYLEQVQPGKYGIPRSWSWPLESVRHHRIVGKKRRESIDMHMVETQPDENTTVRVNNLTKSYGHSNTDRQIAVDHVTFKLEKSKIHGLIGHNGAGKTTTIEMMCGLSACDGGTIEIHDKDLYENLHELRSCIGYCPQQDMLFSHLTVHEQLQFYARVRSGGKPIDPEQIKELLAMMDMKNCSRQLCHTLSGGMQRKLSILCAFVGQANVILLGKSMDEEGAGTNE